MKAPIPQSEFQPPPGSTRLVLVRHGQSIPFVPGEAFDLVDGHGDPPLSQRGAWQAGLVAERLGSEPIDAIYASTLTRTQQTAAPLAARLGLDVTIEADLREVHLGMGEGGRFRQMREEDHPAIAAVRSQEDWGALPGAESNAELEARVTRALDGIHGRHPDRIVAVFCHGGVIGAAVGHALGVNGYRMSDARNGSITEVVRTPDRWIVRSFNDAGHIGGLFEDDDPPG